ncbi:MAG: fumarylacetoacetate hydrolase family protein [Thermoplasmatota archaeon]|jgi:2-keto-4-pentenoate hydratase/2-oxohepta-3-ene-1,7-dioic acid hydratase in catechol pathway
MRHYIFNDKTRKKVGIGKIVCLARNYKKHAQEMQSVVTEKPLLFLKPASSIIFNGESIVIPKMSKCLHHEVELGVVINMNCKNVKKDNALNFVLGYCVALDITARDLQDKAKKFGWPWTIAKSFDTFTPISEVVLKKNVENPNNLDLLLKVNGVIKQESNTKFMVFSVEKIIEFVSSIMTLEKGDLILTGTPEGVGEIIKGDILEAKLGDLCFLKVDVR